MKELEFTQKVYQKLNEVIDPELGIGIVDLGLIYNVKVSKEAILVDMTLTTPNCPMAGILPDMVRQKLRTEFPKESMEVNLVWSPAWTQELISENGRMFLGAR